jgi:hypothetical protein
MTLGAARAPRAAAPELPRGQWKSVTVAVLPVVYLGTDPFGAGGPSQQLRGEAGRWQRALELAFQGRDEVVLIAGAEIAQRLRRIGEVKRTLELAAERYALGLERWRALQAKEALVQLDRARDLYREAHADLVDPRALADVELHRGLALMDLDEKAPARSAFLRMFVSDPARRFERGYYGGAVESELEGAARDVLALPNQSALAWPPDRLDALARRLGVDVWVLGLLVPDGASAKLELVLFDARQKAATRTESFDVAEGEHMGEDLDRMVSAWHACTLEAPRTLVRRPKRRRWYVDFGYTHAVWLQHRRTRQYLHGPGAHVGVTFMPTPGLELWAKTTQRATVSDANADLLDVFTTTHIALGAGLGIGDPYFTFTLRAGVEVAFSLADIAMTTDVDCKFFGPESERCRGIFRAESPALWLGFDFSASLRFAPSRSWYLGFSAGTTIYALSGTLVGELNFPLCGTLGFGLPF